jgi:N-acetylglucosamine-6-phosphate deacetylase
MANRYLDIINARLCGYQGLQRICLIQGKVSAIVPMQIEIRRSPLPASHVLDMAGDWVSQGGVDLQINGALGLAFPDLDTSHLSKLAEICRFLWSQGIDGFLPTLVTTSVEKIERSLCTLAKFNCLHGQEPSAAQILGIHLEGPFLNAEKRGAHPAEYLLPLTVKRVKEVLGEHADLVKIVTLAPELNLMDGVIPYLKSLGIIVSLGHSLATATQAQVAFEQGASMVTHAFNAMPGLHHREPGLLGAALTHPRVACGVIADGQHVHPTMLDLLLRANQNLFLVSDALAPLGLPDGTYPWDSRQIHVTHGTARLPDGTLAGTTLPLLVGAQNLVQWGICDVERSIDLVVEAPRRAIGLPKLAIGQLAHLVRWHWQPSEQNLTWQRLKVDR